MLDLLIRGGAIVDGSGGARYKADIGVRDGRILAIGTMADEEAKSTVDASGQVVAPGFVDIHTHYDAQVFWDRTLSPSCYHGVTTVISGNCGFTLAPLSGRAEDKAYLVRMLARVEGMPLESLQQSVPMDWHSFGEYLSRFEGSLAINAGFMVGHSALRRAVMGPRAVGHMATAEELQGMQGLLRDSLKAGGLGLSTTVSSSHNDAEGQPVPSRHASREELIGLARVVSEFPGTSVELIPLLGAFTPDTLQFMTDMSLAAQRAVNWNVLNPTASTSEIIKAQLYASDYAAQRGARVLALVMAQPATLRLNFHSGFVFDSFPGWADVIGLPPADRKKALMDPKVRERMRQGAKSEAAKAMHDYIDWGSYTIEETFSEPNAAYQGLTVSAVAAKVHRDPLDVLLDVAVADDLKTTFRTPPMGADDESWRIRARAWHDDRTILGASDAGAHLDMLDTFAATTQVLGVGVRERHLLTLEQAVHQLTQVPARLVGFKDRGLIKEGYWADLVVFDPDTVASDRPYMRFDMPAGAGRLYADAKGISHVIVNGRPIIRDNKYLGVPAGKILKSGTDTYTVALSDRQ